MKKNIILFVIFAFTLSCERDKTILFPANDNEDGLEYFIAYEPIEGYCYIHDKPFVADWLIAVDDSGNVIEDTTDYAELSDTTIFLKLFTDEIIAFREQYKGYRLLLVNKSVKYAKLKTQDGRLYLFQEAKDQDGKWKAIEKLTPSFCGNSYYSVVLSPSDSCYFTIPIYRGELITKLRFKLLIEENDYILTNEFTASINRSQFIE